MRDFDGRFLHYEDKSLSGDEAIIHSLEELIKKKQSFLEWTFKNDNVDEIGTGYAIEKREGERRALEEKKHAEEVQFLKRTNAQLKKELETYLAPTKK